MLSIWADSSWQVSDLAKAVQSRLPIESLELDFRGKSLRNGWADEPLWKYDIWKTCTVQVRMPMTGEDFLNHLSMLEMGQRWWSANLLLQSLSGEGFAEDSQFWDSAQIGLASGISTRSPVTGTFKISI
jgi:hypothetical protein